MSSTARRLISSGSTFEAQIGYSRAVIDGDWVFVSGTTGYDYSDMSISDDVAEQTAQALRNIGAALTEAGASFADVVRVHYLLPDANDFEACWPALREVFGVTNEWVAQWMPTALAGFIKGDTIAKLIATMFAIAVNFLGNRLFVFKKTPAATEQAPELPQA